MLNNIEISPRLHKRPKSIQALAKIIQSNSFLKEIEISLEYRR
jgi:hypothetical protein